MHFFEKYVRIKIENHKIVFLMSNVRPKLDEVNAGYPVNIIQSCQTSMYFISLPNNYAFFFKYVRIKIEDYKILVLMSYVPPKLDEVNAGYPYKYDG